MAPRRVAAKGGSRPNPTVKRSNDFVVKRPARGYHIFKNGMLNAAPKRDEMALVQSNQNSPLLRLPAEIRNHIFQYTLGGKIVREDTEKGGQFRPEPRDRLHTFALLGTCRQIYAECALLPYADSIFSANYFSVMAESFKILRKYQRSQIIEINIELDTRMLYGHHRTFSEVQLRLNAFANVLPGLRRFKFCLFSPDNWQILPFPRCENIVRWHVEPDMRHWGYEMVVERMDTAWDDFHNKWSGRSVLGNDETPVAQAASIQPATAGSWYSFIPQGLRNLWAW